MRTSFGRIRLVLAGLVGVSLLVVLAIGCQTYDFEPVQPLAISQKTEVVLRTAKQLKPDLMLLVDKSGSMDEPADPTNLNCKLADAGTCGVTGAPACNTSTCPTRWSSMKDAMGQFLTNSGTIARMGLGFFPDIAGGQCGPTTSIAVPLASLPDGGATDDDTTLGNFAQNIEATISGSTPAGGTPTSLSLAYMGQQYQTYDTTKRRNFILLLTDGLPNCNPDNPNTSLDPTACQCTTSNCSPTNSTQQHEVCLDQDATVNEISGLADAGVDTIVVGFGAETSTGNAPQVLTAMANAGGFPRNCADAGSGCTPYYQASSATDLANALAAIGASIQTGDPCEFALTDGAPSDPSLLTVLVNGQVTDPGPDTWRYDVPTTTVWAQGALCQQINSSTPADPVVVEIRAVQSL